MYFDKIATIQRLLATDADSDKENYGAVAGSGGISVNVQPSNAETVALINGVFGKTYTVFTTVSGIKDGDRLTISGRWIDGVTLNKQLQVMNVGNWFFPPLPHYEITCVEIEQ
jgi:hypothetical protein